MIASLLRVAVLVDLPRSPLSGGHVKGWERRAVCAAENNMPIDLTVYFSGPESNEQIGEHVRFRSLPPVFSTKSFKFLYFPDHTDLAPYHPLLARELSAFDVIHTTDGYFNFARTAGRVSQRSGIPLVTSIHTATPEYARIFTKRTIEEWLGTGWLGRKLIDDLDIPGGQERKMIKRLRHHISLCHDVMVQREEDRRLAESILSPDHVHDVRTCINRKIFGTQRRDRGGIERDYKIPPNKIIVLFVGRMDVGKNIYTLIEATEKLLGEGLPIHVLTAGLGPATDTVRSRLGEHATIAGYVEQNELGRLYASVDALALTSEVEVRSFVGVEALASGCPVLVSEKSGIAPLFENTPAMKVVKGTVLDWTNSLRGFVNDPEQRQQMRHDAADYGQSHFLSWEEQFSGDFMRVWKSAFDAQVTTEPVAQAAPISDHLMAQKA